MVYLITLFLILIAAGLILIYQESIREAAIKAFLITAGLLAFLTEFLSVFDWITRQVVRNAWIFALILAVSYFSLISIRRNISLTARVRQSFRVGSQSIDWVSLLFASMILIILAVTALIAWRSPPNTFDSMTYHMPRVSHWIQNQNIRFYATSIPRQNYSMPFAEYAILHLQLLSGSDRYANFIQWMSFSVSILLVTQILRELNHSSRAQWFGGCVAATIPMAILQSTSTQNDLVVSVFCLSFAYFLYKAGKSRSWMDVLYASIALGLALLTKGTAYLFCAAIGIFIGGLELFQHKWRESSKIILRFLVIILLAILISTGHYLRNYQLEGHPLSTSVDRTINDQYAVGVLFSNFIRNSAIHLATPFPGANQAIYQGAAWLLGERINDPDSTFVDSKFSINYYINDDDSGNLLHFLLLAISIPALLVIRRFRNSAALRFVLAVIGASLLFNLFLKWQPWGSRLQTPIFLFGAILIGGLFSRVVARDLLIVPISGLFFIFAVPYLVLNTTRPLLPVLKADSPVYQTKVYLYTANKIDKYLIKRPELNDNLSPIKQVFYKRKSVLHNERPQLYFLSNTSFYEDYTAAIPVIEELEADEVGLVMGQNDWEYPLWVFLDRHASQGPPTLRHILVENSSAALSNLDRGNDLSVIIATDSEKIKQDPFPEHEIIYQTSSILVLYNPKE